MYTFVEPKHKDMKNYKVSGKTILNTEGQFIGQIIGNRCQSKSGNFSNDFSLVWNDGKREDVSHFGYFKDVVNYIKNL